MADGLPRADESQRGQRRWNRDWFRYQRYQVVHESHMQALVNEGLVIRDTLTFRQILDDRRRLVRVNLRGRIVCSHAVVIVVDKWLRVRRGRAGHLEVLGEFYAYHAYRRSGGARWLLRYDNAHAGMLHRHSYDAAGHEVAVETLDFQSLPRLDMIVREAVALAGGPSLEDWRSGSSDR